MAKQAVNISEKIQSFVQGENIILKLTLNYADTRKPISWAGVTEIYSMHPSVTSNSNIVRKLSDIAAVAEITKYIAVADIAGSLNQKFIKLYDDVGSVAFWIDIDDSGSAEPSHGCDRSVEITTINTDDNADSVAAAYQSAIDADSKFSCIVSSDEFTATDATAEDRTDATAGDSGFTVEILIQGVTFVDGGVEKPADGDLEITIPPLISEDLRIDARTTFWITVDFPSPEGRTIWEIQDGYEITTKPTDLPDPA